MGFSLSLIRHDFARSYFKDRIISDESIGFDPIINRFDLSFPLNTLHSFSTKDTDPCKQKVTWESDKDVRDVVGKTTLYNGHIVVTRQQAFRELISRIPYARTSYDKYSKERTNIRERGGRGGTSQWRHAEEHFFIQILKKLLVTKRLYRRKRIDKDREISHRWNIVQVRSVTALKKFLLLCHEYKDCDDSLT